MENDPMNAGRAKERDARGTRFVAIAALALVVLSSVPAIAGLAVGAARGVFWTGRIHLSPGDLAVYLSSIAQAAHGRLMFSDLATTDGLLPTPNPVWSVAGAIAATGIGPLAAYQLLRVMLIPVFAAVAWAALGHFVGEKAARVPAFLLLLFGSGVGVFAAPFLGHPEYVNGNYPWPTDLWVGESNVFLSALYSPHFLASWTLSILALYLLSRAYSEARPALGAAAGVAALALFSFHPFYAATLYVVGFCWLALAARRDGVSRAASGLGAYAAFVAISIPAAAYYLWLAKFTLNGSFMVGSNLLWTPPLPFVLFGFGGFVALGALGRAATPKERTGRADELVAWAAITVVLAYAGFTFERRLLEGLEFPLAALSGFTVAAAVGRLSAMRGIGRRFAVTASTLLLACAFFPSTFYAVATPIGLFTGRPDPMFFFSRDEHAALEWIRAETPVDAVILSTADSGNDILGWGERRVYVGHWAATPDAVAKSRDVADFFGPGPFDRAGFLREKGLRYAFVGPEERALGGDLGADASLEKAFSSGDIDIYRIKQ